MHERLMDLQKGEAIRRAKKAVREDKIRVRKQEELDLRTRNAKIDALRRQVQAGWLPASKLQEQIDKINADIGDTAALEKAVKRRDAAVNPFHLLFTSFSPPFHLLLLAFFFLASLLFFPQGCFGQGRG